MPTLRPALIVASLALLGLLTACQTNPAISTPTPTAPAGQQSTSGSEFPPLAGLPSPLTVRIVTAGFAPLLDPAQVGLSDIAGRDVIENVYSSLTRFDPATNSIQPNLASGWAVSSDGLRWTFQMRDDIMWSAYNANLNDIESLRPVTADDAVFAIWRACHPATAAPHAALLFAIKGCRAINNTEAALIDDALLANTIRAVATSPNSISIELEQSSGQFLTITALPIMSPVAREAFGVDETEWRYSGLLASSGPWIVAPGMVDNQITLLANSHWPNERLGNIDALQINFAGDDAQSLTAWQAGQADYAHLPANQFSSASLLQSEHRISFLAFAFDQEPLNEVRIRRALSAAIDRQRIVDEVLGGSGLATDAFTPPGTTGATSAAAPLAFDPDYAREQLAFAGYPGCQLFPRLSLQTDDSPLSVALAQAYIAAWQNVLNCNNTRFELHQDDLGLVLGFVSTPLTASFQSRPDIYLLTWQADYPDANNWFGDVLHCERGYLQLGRPCDSVDSLIESAAQEHSPPVRAALYTEIDKLFFAEDGLYPIAPIYSSVLPIAFRPGMTITSDSTNALLIGPTRYDTWLVSD